MPLEGWQEDAKLQIKSVGRAIGICEEAVNNTPLLEFIHQMGLYLGTKAGHSKEQGLTKMHEVHMDDQRDRECIHVRGGIAASPECNAWFQRNGSYAANGILQFVRKCQAEKALDIFKLNGHWYYDPFKNNGLDYKSAAPQCNA